MLQIITFILFIFCVIQYHESVEFKGLIYYLLLYSRAVPGAKEELKEKRNDVTSPPGLSRIL